MFKILFSGIWISIVTLISFYMFFLRSVDINKENVTSVVVKKNDIVEGELVSIPIVSHGLLQAYFFVKLSFIINETKDEHYLKEISTDYLYTLFSNSTMDDMVKVKAFGFDNLRLKIKEDLNLILGFKLISNVLIDKLNYLSILDIRFNCFHLDGKALDLITQKRSSIEPNTEKSK
ncbi:hypothetical protein [Candidatus Liberibacter brunswickensis]|uniref:hypothetical protein n=1 Tax=Candidatus Liberibacter brunswickensis TaxID=1968796 RepID=UPI002FE16AAB